MCSSLKDPTAQWLQANCAYCTPWGQHTLHPIILNCYGGK